MKSKVLALVLTLAALSAPCFASAVHLTGNLSADFFQVTSADQIIATFSGSDQSILWGFGWEVILDRLGFGGDYNVRFFQDTTSAWWLDWVVPVLFMSYHPFGSNRILDPFLQVGFGSAGRVNIDGGEGRYADNLYLSLFPFIAAGLALNLDGLLLSAKAAYTPYNGEIPAADIAAYPLGKLQVTLSAGLCIGW